MTVLTESCCFSFTSPNGTLESFFTAQGKLVVAIATKKDYYAVPVEGITLDDETWVSYPFSIDCFYIAFVHPVFAVASLESDFQW